MSQIKSLARKEDDAKGKGYNISTGGSELPTFFNKLGRDNERMLKWKTIFEQSGIVSQCVETYSSSMLSNGQRIEGKNEDLREEVNEWCDEVNILASYDAFINDSCVFGRAYQEKIYGRGSLSDQIVKLKPLDPTTMKPEVDIRGNILGYTQIVKVKDKDYEVNFKPEEILSDTLFPISGSVYGASMVGRAYDDIIHDAKISEATAEAILRHAFPIFQIKIGVEGEEVDPKVMTQLDAEFRKLASKNEIATVHDVEILTLGKDAFPDIEPIVNWAQSRVCTSMGIPEICLGITKSATEASAKVAMRMWYDKCSLRQKRLSSIYNENIFSDFGSGKDKVKQVFNDCNPDDEDAIATWMSKIMAMSQMDPTYIIPKKFIQEKLGINPELYKDDEEDEPYGLNPEFEDNKDTFYGSESGINAKRKVEANPKDKLSGANSDDKKDSESSKTD